MSVAQIIGLLVSFLGIAGLAVYSGSKPKKATNGAGAPIVAGVIMGTLVGGSSTVGTAQLAFQYGFSAWWFTLGGGIACLILAVFYVRPLRHSGAATLVGIVGGEYGPAAKLAASLLNSVGTFINILSQLIAGTAVLAVIAPSMGMVPALIITAAAMTLYVVFGGTQGAGMIGILKLVLLYISMVGCGIMVLHLTGGLSGFREMVTEIDNPEQVRFYSLFARGIWKDGGACVSLILGVLTTQTYAQAVLAGKSERAARTGALVGAFLIPPIGIGGILVGLYMRANYPGIVAKTALTAFATTHLPGLLSGIVLGTLFIAVVGTGAGLAMGVSSILQRDIVQRFTDNFNEKAKSLLLNRILIVCVLAAACLLCTGSFGDTILSFAFMSMGLRGAVIFIPMLCTILLPGKVNRYWALAGIIAGPVAVLLFGTVLTLPYGIDPLFAGIAAAMICHAIGLCVGNSHEAVTVKHSEFKTPNAFTVIMDSELFSDAGEIAEKLGEKLGIPVYDEEILTEASHLTGVPERVIRHMDGTASLETESVGSEGDVPHSIPATTLAKAQKKACLRLAAKGPCVLMDHFAASALEGNHNCISIFIHADSEKRAEKCAEALHLGPATARHFLTKADRTRAEYYRIFSKQWGHAENYTLAISSDNATTDEIVDRLLTLIQDQIIDPQQKLQTLPDPEEI